MRYLLRRLLPPLLGALALIAGLIWILQALRLGHHLIGAGPAALGQIILLSLPLLLTFALPLALAGALLLVFSQMRGDGELLALQAAGASPLQIAAPALLLCAAGAISVLLLAEVVQPRSLPHLSRLLGRCGAQTALRGLAPGRFHRLMDNTTLFVGEPRTAAGGTEAAGVLLAQEHPPLLLVARRAEIRPRGQLSLRLELQQGELHRQRPSGATFDLQRLRFERMGLTLNLGAALGRHLGFVEGLADQRSPLTGPLSCLTLGLLAAAVGLGRGSRHGVAARGLLAVAGLQLALWGVQVIAPGALGAGVLLVCVGGISGVRLATT